MAASALSRLIGTDTTLKKDAQDYILGLSGAFGSSSAQSWKQAPPSLCAGKASARLMSGQTTLVIYPKDEVEFLTRFLQPYEHQLKILFQGLYGAFSPFLSTPFEDSLSLSTSQSEVQAFLLLTIYLIAIPHLEASQPISPAKTPLRKAVDALLRRAIHSPLSDHLNIFALHNCASFLLIPVDGLVEDCRLVSTPEQENDGLLEFAHELNPRAAIVTALLVAQRLDYANLAAKLPLLRQAFEVESPRNGTSTEPARDEYAHAVLCTFTWLTLLQFRASIDVAEDRIEWESLAQFELGIPRVRFETMTTALMPPPAFLSPREQSRCCWMAQRTELYAIARDHRHTRRTAATLTKKEAEDQASDYKKALDEWRYKFNEQMRSMSTEFRKDPRGLSLHRFYSVFSNAEAASLHVCIGAIYHNEFVADMRQRLADPFFHDNVPYKTAAAILIGHDEDPLTKAILINLAYVDAMLKALGLISSLTPVMPQLYDFVSYEESAGSEIPSLCIVAPPTVQAGLFALPVLAAADLRLSVIESWGASASYFNPHLLPLMTNCVKSLRACHVNVNLPGALKIPFATANPIADYLQGPFEILMRKVALAEERLQISHVESILQNSFLLSSRKKQIEILADELAPDIPEMVQNIADSQKIEDDITASMMGSLQVQSVPSGQDIVDAEYAVKLFGSDLREANLKLTPKPGRSATSSATTPDAEGPKKVVSKARSGSALSEQSQTPSVLTKPTSERSSMHSNVRSLADFSQLSSPGSSIQSTPALYSEPATVMREASQFESLYEAPGQGPPIVHATSATYAPPSLSTDQQQCVYQPAPQHAVQAELGYPQSFPSEDLQASAPSSSYRQPQDARPASSHPGTHGDPAFAPYPMEQRHPTDGMTSMLPNGIPAHSSQIVPSMSEHAYRTQPDYAAHLQSQPLVAGSDNAQRAQGSDGRYDSYHPPNGAHPPPGHALPSESDAWNSTHQHQHPYGPQYGAPFPADQGHPSQQVHVKHETRYTPPATHPDSSYYAPQTQSQQSHHASSCTNQWAIPTLEATMTIQFATPAPS